MTEPETVPVEFHAQVAGSAPLTWGQQAIWRPLQSYGEDGHYFNDVRVLELPTGCDLSRVLTGWRRMVERHQILRTRFRPGPDGRVAQYVERDGVYPVLRDATPYPHRLAERLTAHSFRPAQEWPVTLAVVTAADDRPTHAIVVASHLAVDGWGMQLLVEEFRRLVTEPDVPSSADPAPWGPLEQARWEDSASGRAGSEEALDYWRDHLTVIPPSVFEPPADPAVGTGLVDEDRHQRFTMDSVAVAAAAELLATRCRTSTSTVLLAATALGLSALTGRTLCVLQLIGSNRHDARRRSMLDSAVQNALFVLPVGAGDLTDVIRQTALLSLAAYHYAHYDPAALDTLIAEVASERSVEFGLTAYFNDARLGIDRWDGRAEEELTEEQLHRLVTDTMVYLSGSWRTQGSTFFLHVNPHPDRCRLQLLVDTAVIPPTTATGVLRGMENLLVRAAFRAVSTDQAISLLRDAAVPASA